MIVIRIVLFVLILILALIFAYYNLTVVELNLFNYSYEIPLFLALFVSFISGFIAAYLLAEARGFGLRRYAERVRKGMLNLWKGYPSKAEGDFSRLLNHEEILPLLITALKEQGRKPAIDLQRYESGIAETALAQILLREDREKTRDLLEKALGGIFFLDGEVEKALELQRSIVSDCERSVKEEERRILASILAESGGEESAGELEKLPPAPLSLAVLSSLKDHRRRRKHFSRSFSEGIQNEVLMILVERNTLSPEIVEAVEDNRERFSPETLAMLYLNVGMYEKLEGLKESLPEPIKLVVRWGAEECGKQVLSLLKMWECSQCGREYALYTPVCNSCFEWNKLRIRGGR